ncbi:DUF916 domain-containing protein [Lacticaseibacillus sp. GG6-2]
MKKFVLLFLTTLMALLWLPVHQVHAATPGFAVATQPATNQIDPKASAYQLLVSPNQKQTLSLTISNYTNGTHRYRVAVNRATTNANGQIDYTRYGVKPPANSQANIEQLFDKPKTVSIAPRSEKSVTIHYTAPAKPITGILLGGLQVTCLDSNVGTQPSGVSSQVAYITAVQLQSMKSVAHMTPDLKMANATVKAASTGVMLYANITNPLPVIQTKMAFTAKVYPVGKKHAVLTRKLTDTRLAPNSTMPLLLNTTPKDLKSGDYKVVVDAKLPNNQGRWHFSDTVHVTEAVVKNTDQQSANQRQHRLPLWVIGLLVAVAALLALVAIWLKMRNNDIKHK